MSPQLRAVAGLVAVVAALGLLTAGCSAGGAPVGASVAATHRPPPPDPDPTSPTAADLAPPADVVLAGPPALDQPVPTSAAAGPASATTSPTGPRSAFCRVVDDASTLVAHDGMDLLRDLAASQRAAAPQISAAVADLRQRLTVLGRQAPEYLRTAAARVQQGWADLSTALEQAAWERTKLVAVGLAHLTSDLVRAGWDALASYTRTQCGVDLGASA